MAQLKDRGNWLAACMIVLVLGGLIAGCIWRSYNPIERKPAGGSYYDKHRPLSEDEWRDLQWPDGDPTHPSNW